MDLSLFAILLIIFLAVTTESLSGFGSALVAMSVLPALIGIRQATPLIALVGLALEIVLALYYRVHVQWRAIWRIIVGAALGIPFGILFLRDVNERLVLTVLGLVLVAYAVYSLARLRLPALANPNWAWPIGLIAGLLGGAYNTSGPPVVIYGQSQNWSPPQFKGNLQSFFLVNSAIVIAGHTVSGNVTPQVLSYFLVALPAIALGVLTGLALDRRIDPLRFRQLVQLLLIGLGLRLILS